MAEFEAKVYRLTIEEHPNADVLELAVVGDYRSIVRKGQFKTGDLGVYIPEGAVVPDWLIKELGLEGRLAGKDHNRVKAIKLRGVLSQGLVVPCPCRTLFGVGPFSTLKVPMTEDEFKAWKERGGDDVQGTGWVSFAVDEGDVVTDRLGITKYEPPIPVHMSGEVFNAFGMTLKYDIENFKKYPDVLKEGEEVIMTEKIHGTWCCLGYHPDCETRIITSKGLSAQGLAFKVNEANENNLYLRALDSTAANPDGTGGNVLDRMQALMAMATGMAAAAHPEHDEFIVGGYPYPFYILGEVYGKGVQDLAYGTDGPQFRVFDIYVGEPGHGMYIDSDLLQDYCAKLEVPMVPIVYRGPFSREKMEEVTNGKEVVSGQEANIREGVVIKPVKERRDVEIGRVILKSVSEAYLLREGGTEFN